MSIQKLKNRLKGLETELFRQGGRIPKEEKFIVVNAGASETEKVQKEFEIRKAELREKYGDFDDTEAQCIHIIGHFNPEDLETNETS